jgi:cytochrome c oxidase subunit 2
VGLHLSPRLRRAGLWTVASAGLLALSGCSAADQDQIARLAMPEPATDRAPAIYDLWQGAWIAAMITGVVVWGLIGYACFAYRRRHADEIPVQTRYNLPIEILYTVAPVVIVLVFFYYTVTAQNEVLAEPTNAEGEVGQADHDITVVGQQWSWAFNYMGEDAVDGQDVYLVGTPAERPTLVLPVDESVEVTLLSPDVIHSFWVPAFLFKMDVVPGRENSFSFTPTREGTFEGRCAELCGSYHSRMLFDVDVVSAEEYDDYLRSLEEEGNVGTALGGADADTQAGLEEEVQDNEETGSSE